MKRKDEIKIYIFVAMLVIPTLVWLLLGVFAKDTKAQLDFKLEENRNLASWPEGISSDITSEIEAYYNDHAPFRSMMISVEQSLNSATEKYYRDHIRSHIIEVLFPDSDYTASAQGESDGLPDPGKAGIDTGYGNEVTIPEGKSDIAEDGHTHDWVLVDRTEVSYLTNGRSKYKCSICGEIKWEDFEPKYIDRSYYPLTTSEYAILGRFDWLFYKGDRSLDYYSGKLLLSDDEMQDRLDKMQALQDACDKKGIRLVYMILPNKELVYSEYMPTMPIASTVRREERLVKYIKEHSDLDIIYPFEELVNAKRYYDTYYPYDTHWNNIGSFVGTMALYEVLGLDTVDVSEIDTLQTNYTAKGLVLSGGLSLNDYTGDYDQIVGYKPEIHVIREEGLRDQIFGYDPVYTCDTEAERDMNFVLVGDSFRVWMLQYVEKDFSHLCFVQRENADQVKDEIQDADILVVSAVERFDEDMFANIPLLTKYISEAD